MTFLEHLKLSKDKMAVCCWITTLEIILLPHEPKFCEVPQETTCDMGMGQSWVIGPKRKQKELVN